MVHVCKRFCYDFMVIKQSNTDISLVTVLWEEKELSLEFARLLDQA